MVAALLLAVVPVASPDDFDARFTGRTLRFDYHHCGSATQEQIAPAKFRLENEWAGSRTQLVDELKPDPSDLIVHKHRLSGFHDNELDSVLRNRGIDTLLFSGTNTDRCVFSTLCDASFLGYGCLMVTDACASGSPAYVTDAIGYLVRLLYGVTLRSDDLIAAFAAAGR